MHAGSLRLQTHTNALRICNTYCFAWQEWLREHTSVLQYAYTACLVSITAKEAAGPTQFHSVLL